MNLATLAAEIARPAYADLPDAAIAAAINAGSFAVTGPIKAADVKKLWGRRMTLARCWAKALDPNVEPEVRTLCRATYDNLMGDLFGDLDPADETQAPEIAVYLGGLVAAGVMTEQDQADTLALAQATLPGTIAFLGRPLDESDIANARAA